MSYQEKAEKLLDDILYSLEEIHEAELRGAKKMREAAADKLQAEMDILSQFGARSGPLQAVHYRYKISELMLLRDTIRALDPKKVLEEK